MVARAWPIGLVRARAKVFCIQMQRVKSGRKFTFITFKLYTQSDRIFLKLTTDVNANCFSNESLNGVENEF